MTFDVDKYRSPYDPEAHWKLKKAIIERFMDDMPEDRLVCLATCFVNMEILGCKYPAETEAEIEKMKEGISDVIDEFENSKKDRAQKIIVDSHSRYRKGDQVEAMKKAKESHQSKNGNPWDTKRPRLDQDDSGGRQNAHKRF